MSATKDKSQRHVFDFKQNFYLLYKESQKKEQQKSAISNLQQNLLTLNSLHQELRGLIEELENLVLK